MKWEYQTITANSAGGFFRCRLINGKEVTNWEKGSPIEEYIDKLGNEQWELVTVEEYEYTSQYHYFWIFYHTPENVITTNPRIKGWDNISKYFDNTFASKQFELVGATPINERSSEIMFMFQRRETVRRRRLFFKRPKP